MDFIIFSEILKTYLPAALLALAITFSGNSWINYLYTRALQRDSLSFPEHILQRAKWRKPLLFIVLLPCFGKAWQLREFVIIDRLVRRLDLQVLHGIVQCGDGEVVGRTVVGSKCQRRHVFHGGAVRHRECRHRDRLLVRVEVSHISW